MLTFHYALLFLTEPSLQLWAFATLLSVTLTCDWTAEISILLAHLAKLRQKALSVNLSFLLVVIAGGSDRVQAPLKCRRRR